MREFAVRITLPDNSHGWHRGMYPNGCWAIERALHWFPTAKAISAMRVKPHAHPVTTTATTPANSEAQP